MSRRPVILAAMLLAFSSGCSTEGRNGGQARTPASAPSSTPVPEARTEVGAGRLGRSILVIGGLREDGAVTDRVDRFDLDSGRWTAGPPLPEPLHHLGVAAFRGRLFVAGGYGPGATGPWTESDKVWSLGSNDSAWRAEPSLANARGALGLAATPSHLVAFGGTVGGQVVSSVEVWRAGTAAWRPGPPMARVREHLASASAGGRVYAIAGRVGSLDTNLATVESFAPAAFNGGWRDEPGLATPRGGAAAATVGGTVCVAGGEAPTGTIASIECLRGGGWRTIGALTEARHGLGVVAGDDGRLHVLAGGPTPGLFVSPTHEIVEVDDR